MTTKRCSKCGEEKALCEFSKNKSTKDGLRSLCKTCDKAYKQANKEKIAEQRKAYRQENKEKIAEQNKAYYEENKDKIAEQKAANEKKRMANDPAFKMKKRIGSSVYKALKKQGKTKGGSTFSALPYTPQDLVEHLEKQFDEKMNWDNYGTYWHLDHIYPQSLFPHSSLEDENFQKCWTLENLQPLEAKENMSKGSLYERERHTYINNKETSNGYEEDT